MLSREKFKEYLGELKDLLDLEENLNNILKKFMDDDNYFSLDRHTNLIVKLLSEAMNDKSDCVASYVYDSYFGKYKTNYDLANGLNFDNIKDLDELYDYIVKINDFKIFVISDSHFNHKNIIKYCNRPFDNIYQMNEEIIKNWNKKVSKNDIVFHLGDFGLGSQIELKNICEKLNGRKILILGNHDRGKTKNYYEEIGFEKVYHSDYVVGKLVLSHYPRDIDDDKINIYGHIHNAEPKDWYDNDNHFCVSVEKIDYTPIEITELLGVNHEKI